MIAQRKYILTLMVLMLVAFESLGMDINFVRHYSFNDGLRQSTIKDIIQDKNGCIWLATFDGLVRFDGYEFESHKVLSSNYTNIAHSNRVDNLSEDKFGRFWIHSLSDVYCYLPTTGAYWGISQIKELNVNWGSIQRFEIQPSGKVWLLPEHNGAISINDSLFNYTTYFTGTEDDIRFNRVYEDIELNTWLMTDHGLGFASVEEPQKVVFPLENDGNEGEHKKQFYHAYESDRHIWFGSENGTIWRYTKSSRTFRRQKAPTKSGIRHIIRVNDEVLVFITERDGFFIYTTATEEYVHVNSNTYPAIHNDRARYMQVVGPNEFWFSTDEEGIFKINVATLELKKYFSAKQSIKLENSPLSFIIKNDNGQLLVQPQGGSISVYNTEKDQLEPLFKDAEEAPNELYNFVNCAFFDKQQNLWLSTFAKGLDKINVDNHQFEIIKPATQSVNNLSNNVRAIFESSDEKVWVATKDKKLMLYSSAMEFLGFVSPNGKMNNSDWPLNVYTITEDKDNNIWLGTRGAGVYRLSPIKNSKEFEVIRYRHQNGNPYSLNNNDIYNILQDKEQNIWIATLGGGVNLIRYPVTATSKIINTDNELTHFPIELCNRVRCLKLDKKGRIYAGTTNGLLTWNSDFTTPGNINFQVYNNYNEGNEKHVISDIMDICIPQDNIMYLATFGGGLVKVDSFSTEGLPKRFTSFGIKSGLTSEAVLSIQKDNNDHTFWLSTENELIRFNQQNNTFENFTEISKILSGNIFSESTSTHLSNGKILFGTLNGIVSFDPSEIESNTFNPYLMLTEFKVSYSGSQRAQTDSIFQEVDKTSTISLNHNQNFFNIQFSALDYNNTRNILYAYKLDGFDKTWNYTKKQRNARYTNIPSGNYVFKVRSTNGDGIWADNEKALAINLKPSFWKTPFAYVLYVVVLVVLFVLILHYTLVVYKLKSDIKLQKRMSDLKLKFFTDISHEIRTPLTMITAPVEYMINDPNTPDESKKQLSFIAQSTNRLLKLVNQILDYQKIQDKTLSVMEIDLAEFTQKICLDFDEMAEDKHISFIYRELDKDANIWANTDDLEKVLMNLLSNAFKYNHKGDRVEVMVKKAESSTLLIVKDNGPGIPKEKQKEIYTRFSAFNDDSSNPSTGIGLAIVKEITEKLGATLNLESDTGKGSYFTIAFKNGFGHFDSTVEIMQTSAPAENTVKEQDLPAQTEKEEISITDSEKYKILIVEDDEKLRQFMKSVLVADYEVLEAEDGKEGFNKAISDAPDFIVSDVMMPKRNGIDLLKSLRNDLNTSHIPIILLTAKTDIESKLEGLNYGADDYITKPFSVSYFKARIQNLIKQRKLLQAIYSSEVKITDAVNSRPNFLSKHDENFMEKVVELIHLNLERGDFTIEELGTLVGMSRTTLFNKLKSLTGMSPIEFLRDIRLKTAAQLLIEKDMLIKEVCYLIGFSDLKYFGTCFKAKYGMTPMQYRSKGREAQPEKRNKSINIS